jgi:hypothetical protein
MNTTKAIYWIALGTFALALSSEYQTGNFPALPRAADRAESVLCRAASHAEQSLAMAGILTSRPRTEFHLDDQLMARQQAQAARALAEHQADIDRALAIRQSDFDRIMSEHQAGLNRAMALRQADLDRVQQKLDRVQQVLERVQVNRVRVLERSHLRLSKAANRRISVICPKTGEKISIDADADPDLDMNSPDEQ